MNCDTDCIPRMFADFCADIFKDTNDIAHRPILILHAHVHDTAAIGLAVKGDMNLDPALPEFLSDIKREDYICAAPAGFGRLDYGFVFKYFMFCQCLPPPIGVIDVSSNYITYHHFRLAKSSNSSLRGKEEYNNKNISKKACIFFTCVL